MLTNMMLKKNPISSAILAATMAATTSLAAHANDPVGAARSWLEGMGYSNGAIGSICTRECSPMSTATDWTTSSPLRTTPFSFRFRPVRNTCRQHVGSPTLSMGAGGGVSTSTHAYSPMSTATEWTTSSPSETGACASHSRPEAVSRKTSLRSSQSLVSTIMAGWRETSALRSRRQRRRTRRYSRLRQRRVGNRNLHDLRRGRQFCGRRSLGDSLWGLLLRYL